MANGPATFAKFVSPWGPDFEAVAKELKDKGKPAGRMQTWLCHEDKLSHVLVGKVGCGTCRHYEVRVELDPKEDES